MRHRTPSTHSSSSATHTPSAPHPQRPRTIHPQPTVSASAAKLVRLAAVTLVLALVFPYLATRFFGYRSSTRSTDVTADLSEPNNPHHHAHHTAIHHHDAHAPADHELDVFNFKHHHYLQVAKPLLPNPHTPSASNPTSTPPALTNPHLQPTSQPAHLCKSNHEPHNISSTISTLISTATSFTITLARFALIPLRLLYRLVVTILSAVYRTLRAVLSHILTLILFALAPLTYLVSGIVFVFIQTPYRLGSVVVVELYPVYIFLGAATFVGISMGLGAAGVLYASAFLFVDRVQHTTQTSHNLRKRGHGSESDQSQTRTHYNRGLASLRGSLNSAYRSTNVDYAFPH